MQTRIAPDNLDSSFDETGAPEWRAVAGEEVSWRCAEAVARHAGGFARSGLLVYSGHGKL